MCVKRLFPNHICYDLGEIEVLHDCEHAAVLSTVLYYELAMKVPIPVGITVYLLTWGLGHLRCLVLAIVRVLYAMVAYRPTIATLDI